MAQRVQDSWQEGDTGQDGEERDCIDQDDKAGDGGEGDCNVQHEWDEEGVENQVQDDTALHEQHYVQLENDKYRLDAHLR